MHGYCSFIYNILLIFLSLFSLSVSILGCYKSTQLCPSQFASNPPNTVQPPLNHHHHNPSQHMIFQSQNQPKTKENQTQNQTFNGKLNNLEPKIKLSTKTHQPKPKCLRATAKEKINKKKWREKIMGDEVEIGCDFVIMWWRLKVSGKGNFFEAS